MRKIFVPGTRSGDLEKARVERHLAAIFAADVAGYSRLMGADEEGTHAQLRAHRSELCDPAIERHRAGKLLPARSVRTEQRWRGSGRRGGRLRRAKANRAAMVGTRNQAAW
jgi:hypothetical protein